MVMHFSLDGPLLAALFLFFHRDGAFNRNRLATYDRA